MHVVMATQHLADVGGSETYLYTVAENLVRLGHEVTVHAQLLGAMAEQVRSVGATVVSEDELPETCDAVLVQDVGMAYAMAERWPDRPQVVVAHSAYFDLQLPPLVPVPGSVVVAMSDRVAARVAALPGHARDRPAAPAHRRRAARASRDGVDPAAACRAPRQLPER